MLKLFSYEQVNLRRAVRHSRCRTDSWSFHQYIESLVRPCPRRDKEWSHAATTFRLAARTVSFNDPADFSQPSSPMSLVSSRCFRILSLPSRIVFQEGLLPLPPLPAFTGWLRSSMLISMHSIIRSIIDRPVPRLNVKSLPCFNTIRSFLATISPTRTPLLSRRASPYSVELLLKSPAMGERLLASLRLSSRRRIWVSKTSKRSLGEK